MPIELRPETKDERIHIAIEPSVMRRIEAYAEANGVKKSAAIRYIIASFLESDLQKTKVKSLKKQAQAQS